MIFQSRFRTFDDRIHLRRFDENATLREKRDAVLSRLRDGLDAAGRSRFSWFNQGSYEMGTGVKPLDGDYDIDVGIVFRLGSRWSFPSPLEVKGWVYDAVEHHTQDVRWKEPCITVQYQRRREPVYHVDLAIYGEDEQTGQLYLARGKRHSADPRWEAADPKGLIETIKTRFSGEDAAQFRRVIRYLKRWKDVHFPSHGNAAPVGIGLTVLAYHGFQPQTRWQVDDFLALRGLVSSIQGSFRGHRISARLPVQPHNDVFARMTDQQCSEFKGRVDRLAGWLDEANRTRTTAPLQRAFGPDFPA